MKTIKDGLQGGIASCTNCDCNWKCVIDLESLNPMRDFRKEINNHIKETGHKTIYAEVCYGFIHHSK